MNRARFELYGGLAYLGFRNHLGGWRYILSRLVTYIFFTLVIGEFWRFVLTTSSHPFGFDGNDIIWYCGVGQLIAFASNRIIFRIDDDVRSGAIAYSLMRPINYLLLRLLEGLGSLGANLLLFIPTGIATCWLYTGVLPKGSWLLCFCLIVLSSLLHMVFQVLIGFSGLWIYDVQVIYRIYQKIIIVFGGLEVPITLYPVWAQAISWATPFGLILSRPGTALFRSTDQMTALGAGLLLGWLLIVSFLMIWNYRALEKYIVIHGG